MDTPRFEPSVLKWARETRFGPKIETLEANWSESWTECSAALVAQWESGPDQPSFNQIRKLAEIYKRPLAVFFLNAPPDESPNPPDLRTIGSQDNKALSPDALLVIRKARRVQDIAAALIEELGDKPTFKYRQHTLNEDASNLAERIRRDFQITAQDQRGARTYEDFFEALRAKVETAGVVTLKSGLQDSFPIADCRAFSFADRMPYVILVNNKDTEGGKNFSLAHEFGHLLLREPGICNNFRAFSGGRRSSDVEVFCNEFAASFLVTGRDLFAHRALKGKKSIGANEVDTLAEQVSLDFKVSRVVILRRFLSFGLISDGLYDSKAKEWSKQELQPRKHGGRFALSTTFKKNGAAFSSLVVQAYRQNKISFASASDYLGLKTKHMAGFERIVNAHAAS